MSRTIFFSVILLLLCVINCSAQFCDECEDFISLNDNQPRFWEDPDGIIYDAQQVIEPDKLGLWIYFKILNDDGDQQIISTRLVSCLEAIIPRSVVQFSEQLKIYPNPVINQLTVENIIPDSTIEIIDLKGVLMSSPIISSRQSYNIDVSNFHQGMYILNMVFQGEKTSKLFVIK